MIETTVTRSIAKRINIDVATPLLSIEITLLKDAIKRSHGTGSPMQTSNMFEPIDDDTAISPSPWRATITEERRSGTLVPAARKVRPMRMSGIPRAAPIIVAHVTIK